MTIATMEWIARQMPVEERYRKARNTSSPPSTGSPSELPECRAHCTRRHGWCCVASTGLVECVARDVNPDGYYRGIEELRPPEMANAGIEFPERSGGKLQ